MLLILLREKGRGQLCWRFACQLSSPIAFVEKVTLFCRLRTSPKKSDAKVGYSVVNYVFTVYVRNTQLYSYLVLSSDYLAGQRRLFLKPCL